MVLQIYYPLKREVSLMPYEHRMDGVERASSDRGGAQHMSQFAQSLFEAMERGAHGGQSHNDSSLHVPNLWASHESVHDVSQMRAHHAGGGGCHHGGGGGGGGGDAGAGVIPQVPGQNGIGGASLDQQIATTAQIQTNLGGGEGALGSGFFVSSNGLLATDYHVIQGAQGPINITTADGQQLQARAVVSDQANDLAILQVVNPQTGQPFPPGTFQAAQLGSDADAALGVNTTIGHPNGDPEINIARFQETGTAPFGSFNVTDNTVADNPNRILEILDQIGNGKGIQPGSSGSPVFGANGKVVGIVDLGDGSGDGEATSVSALINDLALAQQALA